MPEQSMRETPIDLTNDAIEVPDDSVEITDQMNEHIKSGVQEKISALDADFEELQEGDDVGQIIALLLERVLDAGETEAILTCQEKDDADCNAARSILTHDQRVESIEEIDRIQGKFGFRIHLKQNEEEEARAA